jgi:glycolate oxidase FAD binding subunit
VAGLGGVLLADDAAASYWQGVREQTLAYFSGDAPLWRCSLPFNAEALRLPGAQLIEWSGAQRWLRSFAPAAEIRGRVQALGGHASQFRGGDRADAFQPLSPAVAKLHERLLLEFDPHGVFDSGRLISGLGHANHAR